MGARARGSRANGLGCESEEGFVERLACGLPEKKVARDWPVSQPSSGGQWWASGGQANGGRVCAGWVGFKVGGLVACLAVWLGRREEQRLAPLSMQKWCSDGG